MPNQYSDKRYFIRPIGPSIAYIPLTVGMFSVVSADHAPSLVESNWQAKKTLHTYYAFRAIKIDKNPFYLGMHMAILGVADGILPDHIDGNGMNNLPHNLRPATRVQNSVHRVRPQATNTSGHRGVTWNKHEKRWKVNLVHQGKQHFLGSSKDLSEAIAIYKHGARRIYGEFWRSA